MNVKVMNQTTVSKSVSMYRGLSCVNVEMDTSLIPTGKAVKVRSLLNARLILRFALR